MCLWNGCVILLVVAGAGANDNRPSVYDAIRREATLTEKSAEHPLPLVGHWRTEVGPRYQLQLLQSGHYILPWLPLPPLGASPDDLGDYESLIRHCAQHHLPLALVSTQWEYLLSSDPRYWELPADQNPNVVRTDGSMEKKVSPFGPVHWWHEVGQRWGAHPGLKQLQAWYPDPPLVLFLSNNEQPKLRWHEVENCQTYLERFGKGKPDSFKQTVVAAGWRERYSAMFEGFRGQLRPSWQRCSRFIGYSAFAQPNMGRWPGWPKYSLQTKDTLSVWPEVWGGCSLPFYTHPWEESSDSRVWSPQTEAMNWVAAANLLDADRPYWIELSTWDGHEPQKQTDKRRWYNARSQTYSPQRYAGMVQYGMWLLRPRSLREFRPHTESPAAYEPYFKEALKAVQRIHQSETLSDYWRRGRLVANTARPHPYQAALPPLLQETPRWYRLDTDLDPTEPWSLDTELDVFALTLLMDQPPSRQWLLYAHAPKGPRRATITVPEYGSVTVDVPVGGGFWTLREDQPGARLVQ